MAGCCKHWVLLNVFFSGAEGKIADYFEQWKIARVGKSCSSKHRAIEANKAVKTAAS